MIIKDSLNVPKRTGFYTLRRTAATIDARSGDPFVFQKLLGHANLTIAIWYIHNIFNQTDTVIENSRKYFNKKSSKNFSGQIRC